MDDVGNVLTKSINASEYSYQYDTAYLLTQANQPSPLQNRTYQYDAVGNRNASDETANWNYNANHQLLSYGEPASSTSLDYDANGSTVTKTITNASGSDTDAYSYDIANRLTELKRNGSTVARYSYDPFGRRISKEVSGVKTYFLYANEGLVGEYNSSGVLINSYMYLPDSMWGTQPLGMMTGCESYFYQHDQLGSPNLLTSNTG
jgi:YD repeat-containing protein